MATQYSSTTLWCDFQKDAEQFCISPQSFVYCAAAAVTAPYLLHAACCALDPMLDDPRHPPRPRARIAPAARDLAVARSPPDRGRMMMSALFWAMPQLALLARLGAALPPVTPVAAAGADARTDDDVPTKAASTAVHKQRPTGHVRPPAVTAPPARGAASAAAHTGSGRRHLVQTRAVSTVVHKQRQTCHVPPPGGTGSRPRWHQTDTGSSAVHKRQPTGNNQRSRPVHNDTGSPAAERNAAPAVRAPPAPGPASAAASTDSVRRHPAPTDAASTAVHKQQPTGRVQPQAAFRHIDQHSGWSSPE